MCIFIPYSYNNVTFTEGRCPGSKGMVFSEKKSQAEVPNVNIEDCDYTIALWIKIYQTNHGAVIWGSSRSGNILHLLINYLYVNICDEVLLDNKCEVGSPRVAMYNWTHIAVTCEQDNGFKMFFNGELASVTKSVIEISKGITISASLPKETFYVTNLEISPPLSRLLIMDLHILGFALSPDEIYDLNRGKQFVEMTFLFYWWKDGIVE